MARTLADREHTNSYFFKTLDLYFKSNGYKNWTNYDARVLIGKSIVKANTEISTWAGLNSFPNEAVVMRLSEIASKDLRYTYGKIIIDYIKKYGYIPSGYGRGHYATAGDVVDIVNFAFAEDGSSDRVVVSDEDLSKRVTKGSKIEAIIVENSQRKPEEGLSPKEFLEQNGWFDKAKDTAEKTAKEISDKMTQNVKEAYDEKGFATLNDIYKDTPLEAEPISQSYGFADKVGMVKPIQNLELANPFDDESESVANAAEIPEDVKSDIINKFLFMLVQRIDESDLMDLLYGHVSRETYEAFYKIDKLCYEDGINLRVVINSIINSLSNEILNGKKEDPLV